MLSGNPQAHSRAGGGIRIDQRQSSAVEIDGKRAHVVFALAEHVQDARRPRRGTATIDQKQAQAKKAQKAQEIQVISSTSVLPAASRPQAFVRLPSRRPKHLAETYLCIRNGREEQTPGPLESGFRPLNHPQDGWMRVPGLRVAARPGRRSIIPVPRPRSGGCGRRQCGKTAEKSFPGPRPEPPGRNRARESAISSPWSPIRRSSRISTVVPAAV